MPLYTVEQEKGINGKAMYLFQQTKCLDLYKNENLRNIHLGCIYGVNNLWELYRRIVVRNPLNLKIKNI